MSVVFVAGVDLEVKECPVCYITYGVPTSLAKARLAEGGNWWCPNGHRLHYIETTVERLEREKKQLADKAARLTSQIDQQQAWRAAEERAHQHTRNQLRGTKAVITRFRKKVVTGRCPCCSHRFKDLARHMKAQHPDWNPDLQAAALAAKEAAS